jgi:predicted nucleic acid-binding Zn ribbon protein
MPIYEYETVVPAGETPVRFEVEQRLHEAPLERHPETGEPVRRLLSLPFLGGRWGERAARAAVSDSTLASHGFSRYVNRGDGTYDRACGDGPQRLRR